jgi:hypothetical protein
MKLLSRWWPMGLIPVFLLLVYMWTGAIGREAVLKQQIKAREKVIAALALQTHPVDTVRLVRAVTHYDTVRTVEQITDTVWVRRFIVAADSAVKECQAFQADCTKQVALRDTLIWAQDSLIHDLKKPKPFMLRIAKPILPFLGGIVTGMILTR